MLKKKVFSLLKCAISIGLISFLIKATDMSAFLIAIRQANGVLFIVGVAISALSILIRSYKWQLLLDIQGAKLTLRSIQAINYMSLFFNNFFLGSIGGDAFRIYRVLNYPTSKSGALSSVLMDRITGVIILFFVVFISAMIHFCLSKPIIQHEQIYIIILLCLTCPLFVYFTFKLFLKSGKIIRFCALSKFTSFMDNLISSLNIYKNHKNSLLMCLLLSLAYQITICLSTYFFALAANENINLLHFFFIVPLVSFILMIPISTNGIGIQEGAFYFYFEKIGIDSSSALLIALLPRIAMLIFSLIGALLYVYVNPKKGISTERS